MKSDITGLSDYAALKKLAAALWQQDNSFYGAAVMVGAGFSRVAASTGDGKAKLPLWSELAEALSKEVGSNKHADPLRLAEEYRAYFGKQAILDLVKKAINDAAWTPGVLHRDLLELPWSEILTTNWDTLLERASLEIHHPVYNIVSRQEDLSSARAPRIVKLHGTINVTDELIFAQEDYRRYPKDHAAFVNFARQVFIENELCLLGFSGDDPNFLQWAGWVRDQLASNARRIYLVGALSLTAAKRKYLESINVAPVDLSPLVSDYDDPDAMHAEATRLFVDALRDLKPREAREWMPAQLHRNSLTTEESIRTQRDAGYAANLLEQQVPTLEADRAAYPGWLTCPHALLWRLQTQVCEPIPTAPILSAMEPRKRANLLYEIAWRYDLTYGATPLWVAHEMLAVCDPAKPGALSKRQQMEIALLLLKSTRWLDEPDAASIAQATTSILEQHVKHWPESVNELAYYRAILARDHFDYAALEEQLAKIAANEPIWKLKKASLLAELGQFAEGKKLVAEAYRELLGQYRENRTSLYVLSRLAWAHWLISGIDLWTPDKGFKELPARYQNPECDPWDYLEQITKRISHVVEAQRERQYIEPMFEPGRYRDHSRTTTFSSEQHPLLLLNGVSTAVGIPLRWNSLSFIVEPASRLAGLDDIGTKNQFCLAIRVANGDSADVLNKVFSRTRIACFTQQEVDYLMSRSQAAIAYWTARLAVGDADSKHYALERLEVFLEVLARVAVRATTEQAKQYFQLAMSLGRKAELHRFRVFDALRHLVEYSLKSIPDSHHHELLSDALAFPLQSEIQGGVHKEWPNPVIQIPGTRTANDALDRRIDEIIDRIAPCSPQSSPALLRLLPLLESGFLTDPELKKIGEKIWGADPNYQTLPQTGLFALALLKLPAPDGFAARNAVRHYLFDARDDQLFNATLLRDISYAGQPTGIKELPSAEQAVAYFRKLTSWRKAKDGKDPLGFFRQGETQLGDSIGEALAYSVIPALPTDAINQETFASLLSFHLEVGAPATVIAFSRFAVANDLCAEQVERHIRQGLHARDSNVVASSAFALLKWRELLASPGTRRLISRLVYLLGSNLGGGLPALLWTAGQLYAKGYLSDTDIESLTESVPVVFDGADYTNVGPTSRESVGISLVRAECVRLARDILSRTGATSDELRRILDEAKDDALPEVRFA